MKCKVVLLKTAVDDLHAIRRFVRRHFSPSVWLISYGKIKKAIEHLESFPFSGHAPRELASCNFLEIVAAKNRVIYEIVGDTVYVHTICDSRQDFKTRLLRRQLRSMHSEDQ